MCTQSPRTGYAGRILLWGWISLTGALAGPWAGDLSGATIQSPQVGPYQQIHPVGAVIRYLDRVQDASPSLYNNDGLNHPNPLLAQHGTEPQTIWQFPWDAESSPVSIEFDLGGQYLVNEMWLWQLPTELFPGQGLADFDIVMRGAGGEILGVVDGVAGHPNAARARSVNRSSAFGECVFLPVPNFVHSVELRINETVGDVDVVGLAEVSFFGRTTTPTVPEPGTGCLSLLGLGGLVWWRRGKRRPRVA